MKLFIMQSKYSLFQLIALHYSDASNSTIMEINNFELSLVTCNYAIILTLMTFIRLLLDDSSADALRSNNTISAQKTRPIAHSKTYNLLHAGNKKEDRIVLFTLYKGSLDLF